MPVATKPEDLRELLVTQAGEQNAIALAQIAGTRGGLGIWLEVLVGNDFAHYLLDTPDAWSTPRARAVLDHLTEQLRKQRYMIGKPSDEPVRG